MLTPLSRRDALRQSIAGALGLGLLGGSPLLAAANPLAAKPSPFTARAKRVILFFMPGGVSHVDTFDPKPALRRDHGKSVGRERVLTGSLWDSKRYGESGLEVS